jgi:hypothetical protein
VAGSVLPSVLDLKALATLFFSRFYDRRRILGTHLVKR